MNGAKAIEVSRTVKELHKGQGGCLVELEGGVPLDSEEGWEPVGVEEVIRRRDLSTSKHIRRMMYDRQAEIDRGGVAIWTVWDEEGGVSRMGLARRMN